MEVTKVSYGFTLYPNLNKENDIGFKKSMRQSITVKNLNGKTKVIIKGFSDNSRWSRVSIELNKEQLKYYIDELQELYNQ